MGVEALFAGQGRPADFEEVLRLSASLQGKIAVVRAKGGEKFYRAHDKQQQSLRTKARWSVAGPSKY